MDLSTSLEIADGVLYLSVVMVAFSIPHPRAALVAAAGSSGLIALGFFLSPPGDPVHGALNRLFAVVVLFLTAYLGASRLQAQEKARVLLEVQKKLADRVEGQGASLAETREILREETMRARALEQGLLATEAELHSLVQSVPGAVYRCCCDADWTVEFLSEEIRALTGYPPSDFVGNRVRTYASVIHPDDRPQVEATVWEHVARREPFELEYRLRHADGSVRWVLERGQAIEPVREDGGMLVGIILDVTQRKRVERALQEADVRYHELVASVDAVVWRGDSRTFRFTYVSPQAGSILGYPVHRWIDEPTFWQDHIVAEDRERVLAGCAEATRRGVRHAFEYRMVAADGRIVWLRDIVTVLMEDGEPKESIGVMIDITDSRGAEQERERLIHELNERVKELTVLHQVARLVQDVGRPATQVLQGIVDLIPTAFQRPDLCAARISVGDVVCQSRDFTETAWSLTGAIDRDGGPPGAINVFYRPEAVRCGEDPFLPEERALVKTLAEQCALYLAAGRAREALRLSEARSRDAAQRTRLMLDALPVLVSYVDREQRYREVNDGYREWFGLEPQMVCGQHVRDVLGPAAYEHIRDRIEAALGGERVEFQAEVPYRAGGTRIVQASYVPHRAAGGSVSGFYGLVQDVSERQRASDALKRSEDRMRSIVAVLAEGVMVIGADGTILSCNESAERILGLPAERMIGNHLRDLRWRAVREDGAQCPAEQFPAARTLQTGEPSRDVVMGFARPEGTLVWLSVNSMPLVRKPERQPYGVVCSFTDITARKEAEGALQSSMTALLRRDRILEAVSFAAKRFLLSAWSDDGLAEVLQRLGKAADVDHVCVFQNERDELGELRAGLMAEWVAAGVTSRLDDARFHRVSYRRCGLRRWKAELSAGRSIAGLVDEWPPDEQGFMSVRGQRAAALVPIFVGKSWWGFMIFGLIHDEHVWQAAELDALQVAANTFGAALQRRHMEEELRRHADNLEQMVTERTRRVRELESQRAQAEKLAAVGQLAAGVAHEINNPIAGIKNAFLVLKEGIPREYPYYQFVGMIEREIERVVKIVRTLYDLYRAESARRDPVALDTLVQDLLYLVQPKLAQKRMTLHRTMTIPATAPRVVPRDLLQVLLNLIQNAIDVSQDGGEVQWHIAMDDQAMRLAVVDQGPGIDPEVLPHIFEPFYSRKTVAGQPGMGLGLSVCYSVVQSMGGRIDVASGVGQGTTFTVWIPWTDDDQTLPEKETGHEPFGRAYLDRG